MDRGGILVQKIPYIIHRQKMASCFTSLQKSQSSISDFGFEICSSCATTVPYMHLSYLLIFNSYD
jgi:hypothetical protein